MTTNYEIINGYNGNPEENYCYAAIRFYVPGNEAAHDRARLIGMFEGLEPVERLATYRDVRAAGLEEVLIAEEYRDNRDREYVMPEELIASLRDSVNAEYEENLEMYEEEAAAYAEAEEQ